MAGLQEFRADILAVTEALLADLRPLALLLLVPIAGLGLVAWAVRLPPPDSLELGRVAIVNLDGSGSGHVSRELADAATQVGWIATEPATTTEADGALREGTLDLMVVIQPGYSEAIDAERLPPIEVVTPGLDPAGDDRRVARFIPLIARVLPVALATTVIRRDVVGAAVVDAATRVMPGVLGIVLFVPPLALGALLPMFRRTGSFGAPTPRRQARLIAEVVVVAAVAMALALLVLTFSLLRWETPAASIGPRIAIGLGVPVAGSVLDLVALGLLTAVAGALLGLALGRVARDPLERVIDLLLVAGPPAVLALVYSNVEGLGEPLPTLARLLPLGAATDAFDRVLLRGGPAASAFLPATVVLALWAFVGLAVAVAVSARSRRSERLGS